MNATFVSRKISKLPIHSEPCDCSILGAACDEPVIGRTEIDRLRHFAELAPGILHDIRNMLSVVVMSVKAVERQSQPGSVRYLLAINTATNAITDLTERLMEHAHLRDWSATSRPLLNVNMRALDLVTALERIVSPDAQLAIRLAPDDSWPIHARASEFDAAILNLATNARDALRDSVTRNGKMTLRTRNVTLPGPGGQATQHVQISVGDNGPGMDQVTLACATDRFFTTKGVHGSGLGLHQVCQFANAAGGQVRIQSTPGRGTIVHLLLPRAAAEHEENPLNDEQNTKGEAQ